jgi:hypothetical protein
MYDLHVLWCVIVQSAVDEWFKCQQCDCVNCGCCSAFLAAKTHFTDCYGDDLTINTVFYLVCCDNTSKSLVCPLLRIIMLLQTIQYCLILLLSN